MTYDDVGNLISVNSTGTTPESAAYSNGNLTQLNTGSSGTYNYSYDNKHNLTQASNQVVNRNKKAYASYVALRFSVYTAIRKNNRNGGN